ncbi:hypothetical protein ACFYNY_24520 [Streptomyces sp. NPDC006530]|uniref:hypothetical protein n=1 Tax=Streptomyces sp. NPDC006530 TaxID=3364750 RepID=UPI0036C6BEEB
MTSTSVLHQRAAQGPQHRPLGGEQVPVAKVPHVLLLTLGEHRPVQAHAGADGVEGEGTPARPDHVQGQGQVDRAVCGTAQIIQVGGQVPGVPGAFERALKDHAKNVARQQGSAADAVMRGFSSSG